MTWKKIIVWLSITVILFVFLSVVVVIISFIFNQGLDNSLKDIKGRLGLKANSESNLNFEVIGHLKRLSVDNGQEGVNAVWSYSSDYGRVYMIRDNDRLFFFGVTGDYIIDCLIDSADNPSICLELLTYVANSKYDYASLPNSDGSESPIYRYWNLGTQRIETARDASYNQSIKTTNPLTPRVVNQGQPNEYISASLQLGRDPESGWREITDEDLYRIKNFVDDLADPGGNIKIYFEADGYEYTDVRGTIEDFLTFYGYKVFPLAVSFFESSAELAGDITIFGKDDDVIIVIRKP